MRIDLNFSTEQTDAQRLPQALVFKNERGSKQEIQRPLTIHIKNCGSKSCFIVNYFLISGVWYLTNDKRAYVVSADEAIDAQGYLLFYVKDGSQETETPVSKKTNNRKNF